MKWLTNEQNEAICNDLLENEMTYGEIALKHNVCKEVVRRRARKLGILSLTQKSLFQNIKECPNDLKQLIIGSLLGDGCFGIYGNSKLTQGHLQITHCMKQLPYLQYKYQILKKYQLVNNILIHKNFDIRFKNPNYQQCSIKTRRNPVFTQVRKECYIDGKKHINFNIIEDIDDFGLAIWYMDDGYITKSSCILSTCSFTYEEQIKLQYFLLGKFNLHFTVGKNDNSMYLLKEDFEKFKNLISPYILECMKYKLLPYKERVLDKSDELLESCDANQQPSTPLTKCEGSETNS